MKMKRLLTSKNVLLIWSGFVLFFFAAQIGVFKVTSRVGDKSVTFIPEKNTALKTLLEAHSFPEG